MRSCVCVCERERVIFCVFVSVENGAISTFAERWPVMIDPQLQGIVWVKEKVQPPPPPLLACVRVWARVYVHFGRQEK